MANFNLDKKKEHEALAEKALRAKDYALAKFHVAQAAKYAFVLADRCEGALRAAYEANGNDLVEIAEDLQRRAAGGGADRKGAKSAEASACRMAERPTVRLDDVAGMQGVKDQIRLRLVEPARHPDEAKRYGLKVGGGILLYGPPGTGKTFLAKAVAGELGLPFYTVTAADVFGKFVGESENNVRNLFRAARSNPLSVVFVDELETIFRRRGEGAHETTQKVITVMLQELDGVNDAQNPILLLGATNAPWMIDEAFLRTGRFDVMAYVGLPNLDARRQILRAAFRDGSVACDEEALERTAARTEGLSGADLKGLAQKVKQMAYDRRCGRYSAELFDEAAAQTSPSCGRETDARIEAWEKAQGVKRL